MIIECPKCKSTFKVAQNIETKNFSNFKCSICEHVWKIKLKQQEGNLGLKNKTGGNFSYVIILNLVIFLMGIIALVLFKDKLIYSNIFWTEFYEFFLNLIPIK